jgi:serine/threonine-protein kinase RsbW
MRRRRKGRIGLTVSADAAGLANLLGEVRAILDAWAVPDTATHDVLVMADELATNIIRHAWNGQPGHQFSFALALEQAGGGLELVMHLSDDGAAFDPTRFRATGLDGDVDEREPGGVGLALVQALAGEFSYRRENGENRIRVSRAL